MPEVLREGPYKVIIYYGEGAEPPHVHVKRDRLRAKFWLRPVRHDGDGRFSPLELRRIERMLRLHEHRLSEVWHVLQNR